MVAFFVIESVRATIDTISFRIRSNLGKDAHCSLLDNRGNMVQMITVSSQKKDLVSFRDLKSHSNYHLSCQVLSKKEAIPDLPPKVLATTSSKEIWTKRNIVANLMTCLVTLVAITCVLFVLFQLSRYRHFASSRGLFVFSLKTHAKTPGSLRRPGEASSALAADADDESAQAAERVAAERRAGRVVAMCGLSVPERGRRAVCDVQCAARGEGGGAQAGAGGEEVGDRTGNEAEEDGGGGVGERGEW